MAKYQSKTNYDWKTSKTTLDTLRRTTGTINELRAFEEQLGLINSVPERKRKSETTHPLSRVSDAAKVDSDNTRVEPAVDRTPPQESLKTEEVHEVRNLITRDEEEKTMERLKKHLSGFIGKGSVVRKEDALALAMHTFKLGMIYHQKGSIDKYLEKK